MFNRQGTISENSFSIARKLQLHPNIADPFFAQLFA
ncbi:Uncharacterised protein [Vibrio cholerae]|nr:Uncharacterised protein [Vibrio cholerae]